MVPFDKRDHGYHHFHGSLFVVPFGKRDHERQPTRKRDHEHGAMKMLSPVAPFAFKSCFLLPFAKKDHEN